MRLYLVAADGACLCYTDTGPRSGAPAVLWLHGIGMSTEYWDEVLPRLGGYRHICLDIRGHGQSDYVKKVLTLEDLSSDVQQLMQKLSLERCVLIGHSMGGAIAQRVALDAPEAVLALILLATSSRVGKAAQKFYAMEAARSESQGRAGVAAVQRAMGALHLDAELQRLRGIPTLILQGGQDQLTPLKAAQILHDVVPGAEMRVFPEAGHDLGKEDPAVVTNIAQWLEAAGLRSSSMGRPAAKL